MVLCPDNASCIETPPVSNLQYIVATQVTIREFRRVLQLQIVFSAVKNNLLSKIGTLLKSWMH